MLIVIVIPARGGSKGILRKNLYQINGKPLIGYGIDVAKSTCFRTIVATEDEKIQQYSISKGVDVLAIPEELTKDDSPLDEVLMYFADKIEFDLLVLMQATSSMTRSEDILRGVGMFHTYPEQYDSVMSVVNTNDILIWDEGKKEALNYDPKNRGRRQERKSKYVIETGGFYITKREQLLKSKCRIGGRIGFVEVPYWSHFQVDSLEDAEMIGRLMREKEC